MAAPKPRQKCPFCNESFPTLKGTTITLGGQKQQNPRRHSHAYVNHVLNMDLTTGCMGAGHPKRRPPWKVGRTTTRGVEAARAELKLWCDAYIAAISPNDEGLCKCPLCTAAGLLVEPPTELLQSV